jgi:hypothetical protein
MFGILDLPKNCMTAEICLCNEVTATDDEVILDGPGGVDVKITPEAAEQTTDAASDVRLALWVGSRRSQDPLLSGQSILWHVDGHDKSAFLPIIGQSTAQLA